MAEAAAVSRAVAAPPSAARLSKRVRTTDLEDEAEAGSLPPAGDSPGSPPAKRAFSEASQGKQRWREPPAAGGGRRADASASRRAGSPGSESNSSCGSGSQDAAYFALPVPRLLPRSTGAATAHSRSFSSPRSASPRGAPLAGGWWLPVEGSPVCRATVPGIAPVMADIAEDPVGIAVPRALLSYLGEPHTSRLTKIRRSALGFVAHYGSAGFPSNAHRAQFMIRVYMLTIKKVHEAFGGAPQYHEALFAARLAEAART